VDHKNVLRIGTFGKAIIEVFNSTVNTPESKADGKLVPILGAGLNEIKLGVVANVFTVLISVLMGKLLTFEQRTVF
jgi:hypothetical protein